MPAVVTPRRHGLPESGGVRMPSAPRLRTTRGACGAPSRSTTCGSPTASRRADVEIAAASVVGQHDAAGMLGLRGADQAPHRSAGQVGDVLAGRGATAPRVATTSAPDGSASQDCTALSARWVAVCTAPRQIAGIGCHRLGFEDDDTVGQRRHGLGCRRRGDHSTSKSSPSALRSPWPCASWSARDRAGRHRPDRQHRQAEAVGQFDRHRVRARRGDPHPHRRRARRVQGDLLPRERQRQS